MRFRLRTLLILIAVLGMLLSLRLNIARRQAEAVRQLVVTDGEAFYDFEFDRNNGERIPGARTWVPAWLTARTGLDLFHNVVAVNIDNGINAATFDDSTEAATIAKYLAALPRLRAIWISQGGDKCVAEITRYSGLERVAIRFAFVTDTGAARLPLLRRLRSLALHESSLTDDSLSHIGAIRSLEELRLDGKRFTDAGISRLKNLEHLKILQLGADEMDITDSGLVHLQELSSLESIWFSHADLTSSGVSRIKSRIPSLDISY